MFPLTPPEAVSQQSRWLPKPAAKPSVGEPALSQAETPRLSTAVAGAKPNVPLSKYHSTPVAATRCGLPGEVAKRTSAGAPAAATVSVVPPAAPQPTSQRLAVVNRQLS